MIYNNFLVLWIPLLTARFTQKHRKRAFVFEKKPDFRLQTDSKKTDFRPQTEEFHPCIRADRNTPAQRKSAKTHKKDLVPGLGLLLFLGCITSQQHAECI